MAESVTIPARFNGPPETGNGGYSCGVAAGLLASEGAEVSLRSPPPLERPLQVRREGDVVRLLDGKTVVAEAAPADLGPDAPAAVSVDEAVEASRAGYERWVARHPFPTCVVCGPRRATGDGFQVFPGPLDDGRYAAAWTPHSSLADDSGRVRLECTWAALDCPTSAPVMSHGKEPPIVLARLGARVFQRPLSGQPHALVSQRIATDGRKRHSGAALYDADGRLLAVARALWIELRRQPHGRAEGGLA